MCDDGRRVTSYISVITVTQALNNSEINSQINQANLDQVQTSGSTGFLPVDPGILNPGPERPFDLYERINEEMVLLCRGNVQLTRSALDKVTNVSFGSSYKRENSLYVPSEQGEGLTSYTENILNSLLTDKSLGVKARASLLHSSALSIMADILANPRMPGSVRRGVALANVTVDFMVSEPWALESMASLFTTDYYTYTHSVHVCVLGVAFYRHIISQDITMLRRVGLGMLLHDTGKSVVQQAILNKPDRLTEDEFTHMKNHPEYGWHILRDQGLNDDLIRNIVLHHHEKTDGSGYPDSLKGCDLPTEAKVAAIVDVYDALTTYRPYRGAMSHAEAMEILYNMTPNHVDEEMVAQFDKVSSRLPHPVSRS